jgi:hypothetical protein
MLAQLDGEDTLVPPNFRTTQPEAPTRDMRAFP